MKETLIKVDFGEKNHIFQHFFAEIPIYSVYPKKISLLQPYICHHFVFSIAPALFMSFPFPLLPPITADIPDIVGDTLNQSGFRQKQAGIYGIFLPKTTLC